MLNKADCETWSLTLREEHRLRVFENKVLRKLFGTRRYKITGEWRKLHNAELHAVYSSPNIIRNQLAVLAQMVACLPLVQQVRGSIPSVVVNFYLKIFNLGARRGGDLHFLIARLYITCLD